MFRLRNEIGKQRKNIVFIEGENFDTERFLRNSMLLFLKYFVNVKKRKERSRKPKLLYLFI